MATSKKASSPVSSGILSDLVSFSPHHLSIFSAVQKTHCSHYMSGLEHIW